jgi:hypothetical protein
MPSISPLLSPVRKYMLSLALMTVIAAASGGALYVYGTGQKLPAHFQVAGWKVGGISYMQFQQQLDQQLKQYNSLKVHLESPDPLIAGKALSLEQLGLVIHREQLDEALERMFHASVTDQIAARWSYRKARLPLQFTIDAEKL